MAQNEQQSNLAQAKQSQQVTHQMIDAKHQAAKRAEENLIKLFQVNPNPGDNEIEAALADDAYNFYRQNGSSKSRAASAFGVGYLGGHLTPSQRQDAYDFYSNYAAQQNAADNARYNAEREAYENNYKYNVGDNTVHVTKDVSDNIKRLSDSYGRLQAQYDKDKAEYDKMRDAQVQAGRVGDKIGNAEAFNDTTKSKRQEVVGLLRQQLNSLGINVGEAPKGGEYDSVDALLNSLDYNTENAVRKALNLATTRTEYTPQDNRSFMDKERERMALQEEVDLRNKNRELERAKNRQSLAGLAATIGEMVRASEGAQVNPRDWQRIYDNLSAQGKANIDNYQVRMQKMRDDARAERLAAAQAAAAAAEKQKDREHDLRMQLNKFDFDGGEKERDRLLKWLLQKEEDSSRENVANIRAKSSGSRTPSMSNVRAFGETTFIPKSQETATMSNIAGLLQAYGVSLGIKNDIVGVDQANTAATRARMALQNMTMLDDGRALLRISDKDLGTGTDETIKDKYLSKEGVDAIKQYIKDVANSAGGISTWNSEYTVGSEEDIAPWLK